MGQRRPHPPQQRRPAGAGRRGPARPAHGLTFRPRVDPATDPRLRRNPMTDERPLLLILRTGRRGLREYLLRSIAREYRVHMLVGAPLTWEAPYVVGHTVCPNTLDDEALVRVAR